MVDSCVPFFVLRFIICLSYTRTGEGHRCARLGAYLGLCLPNVNGRLDRTRGKRKREEEEKKEEHPKEVVYRRRPLSPYLLVGPWLGFQAAFHFCSNRDEHVLTKRYGGLSTSRIGEMGNANC